MRTRSTFLSVVLLLFLAPGAGGQSASEILQTALERHEQRVAGIDNYTVIQNVNGARAPLYFEKRMEDGHPVFEPRIMGDEELPESVPGAEGGVGMSELLIRLGDRSRVEGTEVVEGRTAWVLQVDDVSGLGLETEGFQPSSMTILLDQEEHVPLRMKVSGRMEVEGGSHPVSMNTTFEDYRDVQGLLHPFRSTVRIEGMAAAIPVDDRERMQRQMEEMRKQLEEMPPEQRAMIEQQMKNNPQMQQMMEQMEAMAAGEDMEMMVEVEEIRVNEGPPSQEP